MIKTNPKDKLNNLVILFTGIRSTLNNILRSNILVIILASICSTIILYSIFYLFTDKIWAMNLHVASTDLTPIIRWAVTPGQQDGIEAYILYILAFIDILGTLFIIKVHNLLIRDKRNSTTKFLSLTLLLFLISSAVLFFITAGLTPPMYKPALVLPHALTVVAIVILGTLILTRIARWKDNLANIIIIILLIPVCFIATQPMAISDYSYIFAPALRLINNVRISDIYFQYDLLLSILAAAWMKLKIDLNYFQVLGQLSYYVFFIAMFFFSKKYFSNKKLPYYLLAGLVLTRAYGMIADPVVFFQGTPLRLDLWLIIIIIAYWKGIYSKTLGVVMGAMIVLCGTFGLIYSISYLEIITCLVILKSLKQNFTLRSIVNNFKKQISLSKTNLIIIGVSLLANLLLFGDIISRGTKDYSRIGIGFMPISKLSFFWWIFALISITAFMLIKKRKIISERYFTTGLLLIFLAIGNSMYFFGRSHENNIINVSGPLLLVAFLLFDTLSIKRIKDSLNINTRFSYIAVAALPALFVAMIAYSYSGNIIDRVKIQYDGIIKSRYIYPMNLSLNLNEIKDTTNNSSRLYFISRNQDFYLYYYGGYKPQGYYSPYSTWIYKKDLVNFIQQLINDHYYVAINKIDLSTEGEILPELRYDNIIETQNFMIFSNQK